MTKKTPGQRLLAWRTRLKLNQRDAGDLIGIAQTSLSKLELDHAKPSIETAIKIRDVVGIEVEAWA